MPPGTEAVRCTSCPTHCPQAVRQCVARVALPTAPMQCGTGLQEFRSLGSDRLGGPAHCRGSTTTPPLGGVVVHCRSSSAH